MASLQICRLVALVTSKNRSEVVFLILKRNQRDFRESNQKWTPATPTVIRRKPSKTVSRQPRASPADRHTLERRAQGDQGRAGGDAVAAARSSLDAAHLRLLAVGYRWERNDVAICVHEAGVPVLTVQQVKVPGGATPVTGTAVNTPNGRPGRDEAHQARQAQGQGRVSRARAQSVPKPTSTWAAAGLRQGGPGPSPATSPAPRNEGKRVGLAASSKAGGDAAPSCLPVSLVLVPRATVP